VGLVAVADDEAALSCIWRADDEGGEEGLEEEEEED
jgi:hypothetical protein